MATKTKSHHLYSLKQYLPMFILAGLLGLGVLAATFLSLQSQDIRQRAQQESTTTPLAYLTLSPSSSNLTPNTPQSLKLSLNTTASPVDGAQVIATLTIDSTTTGSDSSLTFSPASIPGLELAHFSFTPILDATATSTHHSHQLRLVYVTSDPAVPFNTHDQPVTLGTINVNQPETATFTFVFDSDRSQVTLHQTATNILARPTDGTYTFNETSQCEYGEAGAVVCPKPVEPDSNFCLEGTLLAPLIDACGCTQASICQSSLCQPCGSAGLSSLNPSYVCAPGLTCAYDHLTQPVTGQYGVCVPTGSSATASCSLIDTTHKITTITTATDSADTTDTQHTIKIRFQGVRSDVGPIVANLTWAEDGQPATASANLTFTHDQNGIYQATTTTPNPSSTNTSLAIKGEKHIQKVFRYLNLSTSTTLDLSSYSLQPGDLPNQDGVVDDADINAVLAAISNPHQTITDIQTADVNFDGTVNAVDMGLILATLSVRPDETL